MLVDDEPIVRKGIRTSINWSSYGIEIVGEAPNGMAALEKALELKPHIVITDIRMPLMDGLQLSENLRKELPDTQIVILSGYEDFAYAKRALRIGVNDYLLKPVGEKELVSLLLKLKEELASKEADKERARKSNSLLNQNYYLIRLNFVNSLLEGELTGRLEAAQKAAALGIRLPEPDYCVMVFGIDGYVALSERMTGKDKELQKYAVLNITEELLLKRTTGIVTYGTGGALAAVVSAKGSDEAMLRAVCTDIQQNVRKYLEFTLSIGIGRRYKDILSIPQSYHEALDALRHRMYLGNSSTIFYGAVAGQGNNSFVGYPAYEKMLLNCMRGGDAESLQNVIRQMFREFSQSRLTEDSVRTACARLMNAAIGSMENMPAEQLFKGNVDVYGQVGRYDILDELENWMLYFFNRVMETVLKNRGLRLKGIVKLALKYMEENYRKDITLADVASAVYVTPNYLSTTFKEEMGVSFIDWLNQLRIEKAKLFLDEPGAKIYEVAEWVGFSDYKYFSSIFKKFTGFPPRQYKNGHAHEPESGMPTVKL
jgi:Response regulator containing CheY-like receiver domain and AraC-type DNA-binding domain